MAVSRDQIPALLRHHGQTPLLAWLDSAHNGTERVLDQLASLDWNAVGHMRDLLLQPNLETRGDSNTSVQPGPVLELAERAWPMRRHPDAIRAKPLGAQLFADGKVGLLLLAGGQSSRLGFGQPKGLTPLPLGPAHHTPTLPGTNSPFAYLMAGIRAAGGNDGAPPPLAVMLSDDSTVAGAYEAALEDPAVTGFSPSHRSRIRTFRQRSLPVLSPGGHLLPASGGGLCMAPDGHGGALAAMLESGTLDWFGSLGCRWLMTLQSDNPAVRVADPGFVGLAGILGAEAGVKVVRREDPAERVGVVAVRDGRTCIVEYTELTAEMATLRRPDGNLAFGGGSIAVHVFSLSFLRRVAEAAARDPRVMPLHVSRRQVACHRAAMAGDGKAPETGGDAVSVEACKFERFLFDVLPHADGVFALEVPRAREFMPLKQPTGPESPETVAESMKREWNACLAAGGSGSPTLTVPAPLTPDGWARRFARTQ